MKNMTVIDSIIGSIGKRTKKSCVEYGNNEAIIKLLMYCPTAKAKIIDTYDTLVSLGWISGSKKDFEKEIDQTQANIDKRLEAIRNQIPSHKERLNMLKKKKDELASEKQHAIIEQKHIGVSYDEDGVEIEDDDQMSPDEINDAQILTDGKIASISKANRKVNAAYKKEAIAAYEEKEVELSLQQTITTAEPVKINLNSDTTPSKTYCVMPITDIHYGEKVPSAASHGNKYNCAIAEARLKYLFERMVEISKKNKCTELHILLGGDLLSGDIHEDIASTNEYDLRTCVNKLTFFLYSAIKQVSPLFEKVTVTCVPGNHSRSTKKMPNKNAVQTNYESLIFDSLKTRFIGSNVNVQYDISAVFITFFVGEQRWMLEHGDRYTSVRKIPDLIHYDLNKPDCAAEVCIMGHWHAPHEFVVEGALGARVPVYVNASIVGPDEFSVNKLHKYVQAESKIFVTDGKKIVSVNDIVLSHIQEG